ncbi:MAG: L-threonylcarbamoyladenylate synthase [Ignavibacterium sp.]|nr:L-threonylcarbamoyladenylate synthase [Ignavibacterium sp.]
MKTKNKIFNIDENIDHSVEEAARIFFNGGVFIYPSDTIYVFGANPFNSNAFKKISSIKKINLLEDYTHLVDSLDTLLKYVEIKNENYYDFLMKIWPNPISVIMKLNTQTRKIYGLEKLPFRIPNNKFCLKLLETLRMPLLSESVNHFGKDPLNSYDIIIQEFSKDVDAIFYSEKKSYFLKPTVIDLSDDKPNLLSEGKLKFEEILKQYESHI